MTSDSDNIDRAQYFRGYAKVKLDHLTYEPGDTIGSRILDARNVQRLVKVFQTEGCNRLEVENYIPVKISDEQLSRSLSQSSVALEQLQQPSQPPALELEQGIQLVCARGKHRIEACRRFGENWWVVELYTQSTPPALWIQLCEKSSNEQCFGDGDIYRNFRHYQLLGNQNRAQQWLNRFASKEKEKHIRRIQSKPSICRGFDRLLPYGCLWKKFTVDNFRTVLDLGHHQQVAHYLSQIYELWSGIFPEAQSVLMDAASVMFLEGKMPQYSQLDQQRIVQAMDQREIFPSVAAEKLRENFKEHVEKISRFITIQTLVADLNCLMPSNAALRRLLPNKSQKTISEALIDRYVAGSSGIKVQDSDNTFQYLTIPCDGRQIALVQLWLYTWRHFLQPLPNNGEQREKMHWVFDIHRLKGLASLAKELGFHSDTIDELEGVDATELYADDILRSFGDTTREETGASSPAKVHLVEGLRILFSKKNDSTDERPSFSTDKPQHRAETRLNGSQRKEIHKSRPHLFLKEICGPEQPNSRYATAIAVSREILFGFFSRSMLLDIASKCTTSPVDGDCINIEKAQTTDTLRNDTVREQDHEQFDSLSQAAESSQHLDEQYDSPSEYSRSPLDREVHSPGIPDDMILAPGFEDLHSVAPLEKRMPITLHRGAPDIINIWEESANELLIVFYFFEDGDYLKFHRQDSLALHEIFKTLLQDHDMLAFYRGDFQLLNNYVEDAIRYQLILAARKDGFAQGRDPYEYVSQWIKPTGKRAAANEAQEVPKRSRLG